MDDTIFTVPNYRIGNDLPISFFVEINQGGVILSPDNTTILFFDPHGIAVDIRWSISGNQVSGTFLGKDQKRTGLYTLKVILNKDDYGMATSDRQMFRLVPHTWQGDTEPGGWEGFTVSMTDVISVDEMEEIRHIINEGFPDLEGRVNDAIEESQRVNTETQELEHSVEGAERLRVTAEERRADAESLRVEAEQGRVNAEALRVQDESLRVQAETARDNAETLRAQAEQERSDAETLRRTAEQERSDAETLRRTAEQERSDAETLRATAEQARQQNEAVRTDTFSADHTRAESDHSYAAADHTRAESDHATAAADHTQASTDHAASTEATTKASNVNVSINGTVVTITDKNGVQTSIDIGFDIHKTYASVSAMNADAANVADGKFVMIATTDSTSVENARLYVRNSNAASSAEPFTFICDLDQAASSAWADWFNNYKPTIESDHTRAESDHTQASTDHATAAADHTQAGTDHSTAAADHTQASTDHDTAAADHAQAVTDHAASTSATGTANAAASLANTAAQAADTAREQLMAKEVTMDDFDEVLPPPTGVDPDYEVVKVVLTDDIGGLNLQGLPVAIYLNGSETASETKTADANGCIVFTLPVNTHYRLAFTQVAGSEEIPDEEHTALLIWRAVERTYKEPEAGEEVTVMLRREGSAYESIADADVTVVYGNRTITKQTDAQGSVKFSVPIGAVYEVVAPEVTGLYVRQNRYAQRFTASETRRNVYFTYSEYEVGVFILASDGAQFDLIGWQEAVAQGTRQNSEAVAIKVSTDSLVRNGGVFALDIDMLASGARMPANKAWSPNTSYTFTSVPANGNSSTAAYYYDGYTASRNIQQEGDEKNISTPAVDACLGLTLAVGEETLPGFLGSVGQWIAAWNNTSVIDQIIAAVRPGTTGRLSSRTGNKWTCTQNSAVSAWYWSSSAGTGGKSPSNAVVPFFAY